MATDQPLSGDPSRDPTRRFSDRVADYAAARPDYPAEVVHALQAHHGLDHTARVVDLGCGTGLLARSFLEAGHRVIGVEPNDAMRAAGQEELADVPAFSMRAGRAEATGLDDASVDLAVAGQAFHWFRPQATRRELLRILRPPAPVGLVWNERRLTGSAFLEGYEALLQRYGTDYLAVHDLAAISARVEAFFGAPPRRYELPHAQQLDRALLRARLLSSSYTPTAGHPDRGPMLDMADQLFDAHAEYGLVTIDYRTVVVTGRLGV